MKYFTPDLFVALQDFSKDEVMNAADAAWEDAIERYDAYYRSVAEQLPASFRTLQEKCYVRDAIIHDIARMDNELLVVLTLDPPTHDLLLVRYELAGEPTFDPEALPEAYRSTGLNQWMYDEVERIASAPPQALHSIQMSNGVELHIPFCRVQVEQAKSLFPERTRDNRVRVIPFSGPGGVCLGDCFT